YAELYLAGRVRAIANIETEKIEPCHRDFLRHLQVKANLAVPILVEKSSEPQAQRQQTEKQQTEKRLWGLLVAHHCQGVRAWTNSEIEQMQQGAAVLANASSIKG
ncbi:MAG: GAF domain-containing protein, partial [Cyanobacteria bacterium J06598_3]